MEKSTEKSAVLNELIARLMGIYLCHVTTLCTTTNLSIGRVSSFLLLRDARCQHTRRGAFETGGGNVCDRHGRRLVGGLEKNFKTRETVKSCRSRSHGVINFRYAFPARGRA